MLKALKNIFKKRTRQNEIDYVKTGIFISDENIALDKYEIKKPDYDYIERNYSDLFSLKYDSVRFVKTGSWWVSKAKESCDKIRVMVVGDITCFGRQFDAAQVEDSWDFNYEFDKVRPIFNGADLVIGNLETMIVPNAPYRTEKFVSEQQYHCNAPLEFLDAVRQSGIDVVTNANNHDMDTGAVGIGETIDNIERFGLIQTGTFKHPKKHYELLNVRGFKIAVVAYATEHNGKGNNLTDEGREYMLNDYNADKAKQIIDDARSAGAEFVLACIHWGKEHRLVQNREQEKIAKEMADMGYDYIIGSHPHVLQPFDILSVGGKRVPVYYSMGNFVSHNADNKKGRTIIACLDLSKENGKITVVNSYIPAVTSKNYGDREYVVLPLNENATDLKNQENLETIKSVIGNKVAVNNDVEFEEYIEKRTIKLKKAPVKKVAKPDISTVKEFPITYDDGKFEYNVYENYADIKKFSKSAKIGSYAVSAKTLDVPIKGIETAAFEGNTFLKKINFGQNMECVGARALRKCSVLEGFQLGRKIKVIEKQAFAECDNLVCAVMRESVEKIESEAFYNCKNLRSVKLPANVKEIADDAFKGCKKAVFYCEPDSYGELFAKEHGYKVINMKF